MFESWFSAGLQLVFMLTHGEHFGWEDADDINSWSDVFVIAGVSISLLTVFYGLSTYKLRKILLFSQTITLMLKTKFRLDPDIFVRTFQNFRIEFECFR